MIQFMHQQWSDFQIKFVLEEFSSDFAEPERFEKKRVKDNEREDN